MPHNSASTGTTYVVIPANSGPLLRINQMNTIVDTPLPITPSSTRYTIASGVTTAPDGAAICHDCHQLRRKLQRQQRQPRHDKHHRRQRRRRHVRQPPLDERVAQRRRQRNDHRQRQQPGDIPRCMPSSTSRKMHASPPSTPNNSRPRRPNAQHRHRNQNRQQRYRRDHRPEEAVPEPLRQHVSLNHLRRRGKQQRRKCR